MNSQKNSITNETKSKIGFVHGTISLVGGVILAYLFMMIFSKYFPGDYAVKIIPSIVLTPIVISIFGIWLLFSQSVRVSIIKFTIACILFVFIIEVV